MEINNNNGERFIFVGGSPRSGTSLTQFILGAHPEIYGGPEFDNIPNIVYLYKKLNRSIDNNRITTFTTKEEIKKAIGYLIEKLLIPVANQNNKKYLSEKTPDNVLYFKELLEIFPRAKFIFVIRDPRAILFSMKNVNRRAKRLGRRVTVGKNLIRDIQKINLNMEAGWVFKKIYPDRVFIVKYEMLITQKRQEIEALCKYLNIRFSEKMLNHEKGKKNFQEVLKTDKGVWSGGDITKRAIDDKSLNKWRKELSYWEIILCDYYLNRKGYISEMGYKPIYSINMIKVFFSVIFTGNAITVSRLLIAYLNKQKIIFKNKSIILDVLHSPTFNHHS